jgi:hypothetical protein
MKRTILKGMALAGVAAVLLLLAGCQTLDVTVPANLYVSTGDYVAGIRTLGVIQEKMSVFAPLFLVDRNKVTQVLYQRIIAKAQAVGADGVTDLRFTWVPSPFMALTVIIASGWFDYYVEGIAIKKQ